MELKEYQQNALDAFARWRDALDEERANSEKLETTLRCAGLEIPDGIGDYPAKAWQKLAERGGLPETAGPYASRTDDAGRPIPHVCLKVPTGGGKTLLAAEALARLPTQTGLRLWITPTRAIYQQTWNALRNREHPYRQVLDRASGGRVKLLEKDDRFTLQDTRHYLCVMLLMLPAANRQKGRDFSECSETPANTQPSFPTKTPRLATAR